MNIRFNSDNAATPARGVAMMLIAFFCFSIMDTSAKWLVLAAVPSIQVAFLRYFVHAAWVFVLYVPKQRANLFKSQRPALQIARSMMLLTATALNFTALKYLPLTVTISIFFATPMLVCLLSMVFLKEKIGLRRFLAIVAGFVGVLVVVRPWHETFDYHVLLALGALCLMSGYFVMSRVIAGMDSNSVTQFYTSGIATMVLAPFAAMLWQWPDSLTEWTLLVLIGSLGMLGHSLLTRAHHYAEASLLAPTVYSQIIYVSILSWLVFGSTPDWHTALGVLIIISSGIYIWRRERMLADTSKSIPVRSAVVTQR